MNVQAKETKAPANPAAAMGKLPMPPKFASLADERLHRKQRLAAGFRLFSKFGFDEGVGTHHRARSRVSGHVLGEPVRRPFQPDHGLEPHPLRP